MTREDYTTGGTLDTICLDGKVHPAATFSRFPNEVRDDASLSLGARMTYAVLVGYAIDSNRVFPSQQTIADKLGCSLPSIRKYVDELRIANLLSVRRRGQGRSSLYTLTVFVESKRFQTYEHDGSTVRNTRNSRTNQQSQTEKLLPSEPQNVYRLDRKKTSPYNDQLLPTTISNDEETSARERAIPLRTETKPSKRETTSAIVEAQREKVEAFNRAVGVEPSLVAESIVKRDAQLFAGSRMPLADVAPLAAYILGDPWYAADRARVTVRKMIELWPAWVAGGRPEKKVAPRASSAIIPATRVTEATARPAFDFWGNGGGGQ